MQRPLRVLRLRLYIAKSKVAAPSSMENIAKAIMQGIEGTSTGDLS
mgnify:CR=1 FL=1